MSDLRAIVYLSSAVRPLSSVEIERLLVGARRHNALVNLTGVLLYADGSFMQYLEGDATQLAAAYKRIMADPTHGLINELVNEPIVKREFDDWAMGYSTVTLPDFLRLRGADWSPTIVTGVLSPGRAILRQVWGARPA